MSVLQRNIIEVSGSAIFIKELADLYFATFNERMKVGCFTCYSNAYSRLNSYFYSRDLKQKQMKTESNFKLSVSSIRAYNSNDTYTNDTLTDEVAISYLKQNKARIVHFKNFPENWEELLVTKKITRKKKSDK